jgi:hypothetical protein
MDNGSLVSTELLKPSVVAEALGVEPKELMKGEE